MCSSRQTYGAPNSRPRKLCRHPPRAHGHATSGMTLCCKSILGSLQYGIAIHFELDMLVYVVLLGFDLSPTTLWRRFASMAEKRAPAARLQMQILLQSYRQVSDTRPPPPRDRGNGPCTTKYLWILPEVEVLPQGFGFASATHACAVRAYSPT
ncbi:hypothetical protein LZ31DRAFT_363700 [Colletotrichum somersetense]|nr:hypothetical protein LZ31DRAFT_363700 [Colletotrichum somersetense]